MDNAQANGPLVVSGERWRPNAAIHANAARAAQGLTTLAVGAGDAVALLLRNDFAFFEASLAAGLLGAYVVPINWNAAVDDIAYILDDCGAKVLVAHADLVPSVLPSIPPDFPLVVVATPPEVAAAYEVHSAASIPVRGKRWDAWLEDHRPLAEGSAAAPSPIIYTSGTTGRPKGVRRGARPNDGRSPRALFVYGLDQEAPLIVLVNGPMYHSVPNAYSRLAFREGASIVLQPRFEPEEMLALIARHRVTHMHVVPAMLIRLLRLPERARARHDLSSLRYVVHGAAPCPAHVKRAMIDWWGPILHEYYGSTETGLLTVHDSTEAVEKPGTVGRALPGVSLAILGPEGRALPPGEPGDVYAGSASLHDFTYVGQEAHRAAIGRGDLVTAGDIGWLDGDGYLFLCDRKRDCIISGGRTVYPSEIEAALLALPGVKDCAVFGIPAEVAGEAIIACVEPLAGADLDPADLQARLAATLEPALRPAHIDLMTNLPREDSGKIFKQRLRDAYRGDSH